MNGIYGIIEIIDDGGTWTGGRLYLSVAGSMTDYTFETSKDDSLTAMAALIAAEDDVLSAVYSAASHKITVTPNIGKTLTATVDEANLVGTMRVHINMTPIVPAWATDAAAVIDEPLPAKTEQGFVAFEKPPAHWFNFLLKTIFNHFNFLISDYVILEGNLGVAFTDGGAETLSMQIYYRKWKSKKVDLYTIAYYAASAGATNWYSTTPAIPSALFPTIQVSTVVPYESVDLSVMYIGAGGRLDFTRASGSTSNIQQFKPWLVSYYAKD